MKINTTTLYDLSNEKSLRLDVKYITYSAENKNKQLQRFTDFFKIVEHEKIDVNELHQIKYCQIGDINTQGYKNYVVLDFDNRFHEYCDYYKKIEKGDIFLPQLNSILLSRIRPYLRKNVFSYQESIYYSKAFIEISPLISNSISFYFLNYYLVDDINAVSRIGKGYPSINENDLKNIMIPRKLLENLSKVTASDLMRIKEYEEENEEIYFSIRNDSDIIDEILCEYFNWDFSCFENFKKKSIYKIGTSVISNNYDCRFSVKFHRPAGNYVQKELTKYPYRKIKDFLECPIVLGKSISPEDYDENGHAFYISMADIKNWHWDIENTKKVSDSYWENNKDLKSVKKNDIIMTRSGVAIGKFALIEEDKDAIFADFTMRIRLKDYNVKFAYYYFCSKYFQYLIEIYYKGVQNRNIFPIIVKEFPIPLLNLEEQEFLVKKIEESIIEENTKRDRILENNRSIKIILDKYVNLM